MVSGPLLTGGMPALEHWTNSKSGLSPTSSGSIPGDFPLGILFFSLAGNMGSRSPRNYQLAYLGIVAASSEYILWGWESTDLADSVSYRRQPE